MLQGCGGARARAAVKVMDCCLYSVVHVSGCLFACIRLLVHAL